MAKGFKHGSGGSKPLNFKVICNPQPETAKENTIWVDTDRIHNHYFSATQPENMAEYDVWFPIGTSSTVEFNALKKNGIQVYPMEAKQYISGALVDKTAKSYQGGKWVDWVTYLYNNGDVCTDITGGWVGKSWLREAGYEASEAGKPTVTNSNGTLNISMPTASGYKTGAVITQKDVDFTNYKTLTLKLGRTTSGLSGGIGLQLGVGNRNSTYYTDAVALTSVSGSVTEVELDVSKVTGFNAVWIGMRTQNPVSSAVVPVVSIFAK